jgi:hypothetical protein
MLVSCVYNNKVESPRTKGAIDLSKRRIQPIKRPQKEQSNRKAILYTSIGFGIVVVILAALILFTNN